MVDDAEQRPRGRGRRRAVGPPGSVPPGEALLHLDAQRPGSVPDEPVEDDERLRRDRPPHHDRGV